MQIAKQDAIQPGDDPIELRWVLALEKFNLDQLLRGCKYVF